MNPNAATGLVDVYSYYLTTTATTTTAGGVAGWICQTAVARPTQAAIPIGNSAAPSCSGHELHRRDRGDDTSYFTSSRTQYQGAGGSGVETQAMHTFFANTPRRPLPAYNHLPVVGNSQNGKTGTAAMTEVVYNALGQVVWSMDANGSISYTAYDPATGRSSSRSRT